MDKKEKVSAFIERVNDHGTSYRLKISDGSKLELDKSEMNGFIPKSGMSVQINLFNNLILQEVLFDGLVVLHRSPDKLLELLNGLVKDLQSVSGDYNKIVELENSQEFATLPLVFQHRLLLLKTVMGREFTAKFLEQQMIVSQIAYHLSFQTNSFIAVFDRKTAATIGDYRKATQLNDAELQDAKNLAKQYQYDKRLDFNTLRAFQESGVLSYKGLSAPYSLRTADAVRRYTSFALVG